MDHPLSPLAFRDRLGLSPVNLFPEKTARDSFLLLNGDAAGSLCINYDDISPRELRSWAWSSNVNTSLSIFNNKVQLLRWDSHQIERYNIESIQNRLESFYQYIESKRSSSYESIIIYFIHLYKRVRTVIKDPDGTESNRVMLTALLDVLNSQDAIESKHISLTFNKDKYRLRTSLHDELLDLLTSGLASKELTPSIPLVLRHVSGPLFQEIHKEALFPITYQTTFENFLPSAPGFASQRRIDNLGTFYTPPHLARTIVERTISEKHSASQLTVLDPACGTGEFLKEALHQLRAQGYKGRINLVGIDTSNKAIDISSMVLGLEKLLDIYEVKIELILGDSLAPETLWPEADIILMNPPFKSWELMKLDQRELIMTVLSEFTPSKPNLSSAFVAKALAHLKQNGVLGCILPSSFFENQSYTRLREFIMSSFDVNFIGRLGSHTIFLDAMIDVGMLSLRRAEPKRSGITVLYSDQIASHNMLALRELRKNAHNPFPIVAMDEGFSIYKVNAEDFINDWTPRSYNSFALLKSNQHLPKASDLFNIYQGVRTGLNAVFLIDADFYAKLSQDERNYFRPAVTNDAIRDGRLFVRNYIFYPYGEFLIHSEQDLKEKLPLYFESHLAPNKGALSRRARKSEADYWTLSEHRAWQVNPKAKIVSKEFGGARSFAFDYLGEYVAERSHAWFPKRAKHNLDEVGYAYISLFSSGIMNHLISGLSKQIAGGQWYLSSKYLYALPIPNFFERTKAMDGLYNELRAIGTEIATGDFQNYTQLDHLIGLIYNGK